MTKIDKPLGITVTSTGLSNPRIVVPVGATVEWRADSSLPPGVTVRGQDAVSGTLPYTHTYKTRGLYTYEILRRQTDGSMGTLASGTVQVGR